MSTSIATEIEEECLSLFGTDVGGRPSPDSIYKFTRGWVKILQQHSNSFRYDYSVILQAFVKTTLEYEIDGHLGVYFKNTGSNSSSEKNWK